eukprot:scaffold169688_cov29-Tisochrysis_lutea.AAC.3
MGARGKWDVAKKIGGMTWILAPGGNVLLSSAGASSRGRGAENGRTALHNRRSPTTLQTHGWYMVILSLKNELHGMEGVKRSARRCTSPRPSRSYDEPCTPDDNCGIDESLGIARRRSFEVATVVASVDASHGGVPQNTSVPRGMECMAG